MLRVIVFPDGDLFIAQALEIDIASQGSTIEEAVEALRIVLETESEGPDFEDIGPAPAVFYTLWKASPIALQGPFGLDVHIVD